MSSHQKFGMLRGLLRTLGLSSEASDQVVDFIVDLLAGEGKSESQSPEFPYHRREHFLSPAELSFYQALYAAVAGRAVLLSKVSLNDLFQVKSDDQSRYRVYTNKIDRKHVDFLLCHPATMQPLLALELDDKSHQRADRQARDAFVDGVFAAAKLPLLHIPARRSYNAEELAGQIAQYLNLPTPPAPARIEVPSPTPQASAPRCPKCGGEMILRTAKNGANAGNKFWGCANYPNCHSVLPYQPA